MSIFKELNKKEKITIHINDFEPIDIYIEHLPYNTRKTMLESLKKKKKLKYDEEKGYLCYKLLKGKIGRILAFLYLLKNIDKSKLNIEPYPINTYQLRKIVLMDDEKPISYPTILKYIDLLRDFKFIDTQESLNQKGSMTRKISFSNNVFIYSEDIFAKQMMDKLNDEEVKIYWKNDYDNAKKGRDKVEKWIITRLNKKLSDI